MYCCEGTICLFLNLTFVFFFFFYFFISDIGYLKKYLIPDIRYFLKLSDMNPIPILIS